MSFSVSFSLLENKIQMLSLVILRIVFGGDDDARKLTLKTGIPKSVDDLFLEIMSFWGEAKVQAPVQR